MPRPGHFTPRGSWYPLHRRLGGHQGQSGQVLKILPPLGFNPWNLQPIVSHYNDYTFLALYTAVNRALPKI